MENRQLQNKDIRDNRLYGLNASALNIVRYRPLDLWVFELREFTSQCQIQFSPCAYLLKLKKIKGEGRFITKFIRS